MTVNTRELFELHLRYFSAKDQADNTGCQDAFRGIEQLGLHPEQFTLDSEELERRLVAFENHRLAYQNRLARLANHTLVGPKIKGEVSETSAALLRGSKGLGRSGQSGKNNSTRNDLANNEEVKETARGFNQIDLRVRGEIIIVGSSQWLKIDEDRTDVRFLEQINGTLWRVTDQFTKNASSIQAFESVNDDQYLVPNDVGILDGEHKPNVNGVVKTNLFRFVDGDFHWWNSEEHEFVRDDTEAINYYKKDELMALLRRHNLTDGGTKEELLQRLRDHGHADAHNINRPEDGLYILLKTHLNATDASSFRITMERPHFNVGGKTPAQVRELLTSGAVMVSRHLDPAGRQAVAFCHLKLNRAEATDVVNRLGWAEGARKQYQPYLFHDNIRNGFYENEKTGVATLGGRLLLYLVETEQNELTVQYSARADGRARGRLLRIKRIRDMLCTVDEGVVGSSVPHHLPWRLRDGSEFDFGNLEHRREVLLDQCKAMVAFYRDERAWTDLANTGRIVLDGKDGEQLAALYSGLRGDRSMARGDDLIEADGSPSEVKHLSGRKGDAAFSLDNAGKMHLGGRGKITSKTRLFVSWMEDMDGEQGPRLHIKLLVTDQASKALLDSQHDAYYSPAQAATRANSSAKDDLQYAPQAYTTSKLGGGKRTYLPENGVLDLSACIAFEFIEGDDDFKTYNDQLIDP